MGSVKGDAFNYFLFNNGGSSKAFTDLDHTNYYFDSFYLKFFEGLEKFAQLFMRPKFKEDSLDKVMDAVDSEATNL